jgi:hypothetical protein
MFINQRRVAQKVYRIYTAKKAKVTEDKLSNRIQKAIDFQ